MENIPKEGWALLTLIASAIIGWITRYFEKGSIMKRHRNLVREAFEEGKKQGRLLEKEKK